MHLSPTLSFTNISLLTTTLPLNTSIHLFDLHKASPNMSSSEDIVSYAEPSHSRVSIAEHILTMDSATRQAVLVAIMQGSTKDDLEALFASDDVSLSQNIRASSSRFIMLISL